MDQGFLGNGWAYDLSGNGVELDPSGTGRIAEAGGDDDIAQSIWLILSTAPGERVGRTTFGCGIYDLVFAPQSAATTGSIVSAVKTALSLWEPRISVLGVTVEPDPDASNGLLVEIQYQVQATNSRFNLVYPFYLST